MTTPTTTTAFYIHANGDPATVLESGAVKLSIDLQPTQVLLKILAAPVNPSDLFGVLGLYHVPLTPTTTASDSKPEGVRIPGFEGVAEVARVGSDVHGIKVGDWVVPFRNGFATWRAHAVVDAVNVFVVVQTAANSLVGKYVIQLASAWGLRTINLIRDRKDVDATKQVLLDLGATAVLRDQTDELAEFVKAHVDANRGVRLALDSVGGASLAPIMKVLGAKGAVVLSSMISGDPAPAIPIGDVIFRKLKLFGFWVAQWDREADAMNDDLVALLRERKIKSPAVEQVVVPSDGSAVDKDAVQRVAGGLAGYRGKKDLIVFQHR
ncbi:mitochondrial 2-enoyl thioester reductase [Allomyces javanicus]|nr:mitochondrial 2-enoyl thioester reductase [Allomyces javanicus]